MHLITADLYYWFMHKVFQHTRVQFMTILYLAFVNSWLIYKHVNELQQRKKGSYHRFFRSLAVWLAHRAATTKCASLNTKGGRLPSGQCIIAAASASHATEAARVACPQPPLSCLLLPTQGCGLNCPSHDCLDRFSRPRPPANPLNCPHCAGPYCLPLYCRTVPQPPRVPRLPPLCRPRPSLLRLLLSCRP